MTERQTHLLSEIIRVYAETAEPVGSLTLAESFDVSPATIRAEMAELEKGGYITHPHTSAGRVPTDKGYRYFVNNLHAVEPKTRTVQTITKRVNSLKDQTDQAIKIATETLKDLTGNASFSTLSESIFFLGLPNLLAQPEFHDQVKAIEAAKFVDSIYNWLIGNILSDQVNVFIGRENPFSSTSELTMVISRFSSPLSEKNYIGIVGPTRQNYPKVIGLVNAVSRTLEEVLHD